MRPPIPDEYSYSHLLGLCLGDGRLDDRSVLRVTCSGNDPAMVDGAAASMRLVALDRVVRRRHSPSAASATVVACRWGAWPEYLPQTSADRADERPIVLTLWQQEIVDREPQAFVRGLIEADGCRVVNRFKTKLPSGRVAEYAYPRYFFSTASAELRGLFCASCERIAVHWTQSNERNISVAHRDSVAILDTFIGPRG